MKHRLKIKATLIALAVFALSILCVHAAQSEQAPVDKLPLDAQPYTGVHSPNETSVCSLIVVECPNEQAEQARFNAIAAMVSDTKFAGEAQTIADATKKYGVNPGLLVGIANAESQVGLHCKWNNCFGIMRTGHTLKAYDTLADGITDAARFLREKMHNRGRFTPEEIVNGYVGHPAPHWLINVRKYYVD